MDHSNLPENSIVSIRFGSTRRQAPLDTVRSHPLKFPCSLEACYEPLKIDVLQPVATARLVLHAHEERYRIGLDTKDKSHMSLGLSVNNSTGGATPIPAAGPPPELGGPLKFQDAAASAREYLEVHGLLRYVQALLHAVIQVRPKDPYFFMMQQLGAAQGYSQGPFASQPGQEEAKPVPIPQPDPVAAPTASAAAAPETVHCGSSKDVRTASTPAPVPATVSTSPAAPAPDDRMDRLKQQAMETLRMATVDGSLETTLADLMPSSPKKQPIPQVSSAREASKASARLASKGAVAAAATTATAKLCATDVTRDIKAPQKPVAAAPVDHHLPEEVDHLRNLALQTLEKASKDGRLTKTLEHVLKVPAYHMPNAEIDQLRALALQTLGKASRDGLLGKTLKEIHRQAACTVEAQEILADLALATTRTSHFKDSTEASEPVAQPAEIDELRCRVRTLLEQACETGSLMSAIGGMLGKTQTSAGSDSDIHAIKSRIRSLLEESCESGKLLEVLSAAIVPVAGKSAAQVGNGTDDIRDRMRRLLEEACDTGKLSDVLVAIQKSTTTAALGSSANGFDEVKERMKRLLEEACDSGRLTDALSTMPKDSDKQAVNSLDDAKDRMRSILEEACDTGKLDEALATMLKPGPANPAENQQGQQLVILRDRTRNLLEKACENGELAVALEQLPHKPADAPPQANVPPAPPGAPPSMAPPAGAPPSMEPPAVMQQDDSAKLNALRFQMRGLLEEACDSGRLALSLSTLDNRTASAPSTDKQVTSIMPCEDLEKLRRHLCQEFTKRAVTGELDEIVKEAFAMPVDDFVEQASAPSTASSPTKQPSVPVPSSPSAPLPSSTQAATPSSPMVPAPPKGPAPATQRPSVEIKKLYDQISYMKTDNETLHKQVDSLATQMEELKRHNTELVDKVLLKRRPDSARSNLSCPTSPSPAPTTAATAAPFSPSPAPSNR